MHVYILLIFDAVVRSRAKLILCLLDLIFYVFLQVVDLGSKCESLKLMPMFWETSSLWFSVLLKIIKAKVFKQRKNVKVWFLG